MNDATRPTPRPTPQAIGPTRAAQRRAQAGLRDAVARMAAEDPERARAFLETLRQAMKTQRPKTVRRVLRYFGVFGSFGSTIAEAARPTRLRTRPASLADSWGTVGRLIGSSMSSFDERHDSHAG